MDRRSFLKISAAFIGTALIMPKTLIASKTAKGNFTPMKPEQVDADSPIDTALVKLINDGNSHDHMGGW